VQNFPSKLMWARVVENVPSFVERRALTNPCGEEK